MSDTKSGWTREKYIAERQDGVSLRLQGGDGWMVRGAPETDCDVRVDGVSDSSLHMEDAIMQVDMKWLPDGWAFDSGHWVRPRWKAQPEAGGWHLYRKVGDEWTQATTTEFRSADRAREWAERRLDRTDGPLRGPKPRAGKRSSAKLPDIRVTETERDEALGLVESMGLTYSQFVRAAIRFAQENIVENKTVQIAREDNGKAHFVMGTAQVPALESLTSDVDF